MIDTTTILILINIVVFAGILFFVSYKGFMPKFMPYTFKYLMFTIEDMKPRYYDEQGKQIFFEFPKIPPLPIPPLEMPFIPPIIEEKTREVESMRRDRPSYDFRSDTTATILQQGEEIVKNLEPEIITPPIDIKKELSNPTPTESKIMGYCGKCRAKTEMINVNMKFATTTRGLMRTASGKCSVCNTNMGTILKREG